MKYTTTTTAEPLPDAAQQASGAVSQQEPLPEHLVLLPGTTWRLWRWAALRGAGFPAAQVLALADSLCAAAADDVLQTRDDLDRRCEAAAAAVNRQLDLLKRGSEWTDVSRRNSLLDMLRFLKQRKVPPRADDDAVLVSCFQAVCEARALAEESAVKFRDTFRHTSDTMSERIREVAGSGRFREAVTWQNRLAVRSGLDALLRQSSQPAVRGSKQRQHEELVASYLQRYCTKNDTIGFFGPVGWARLEVAGGASSVRPGPQLLASRRVYFEAWCINAFCEALGKDESLRPWMIPRRLPFVHIEAATLHLPLRKPYAIPAAQAAVLASCDGLRTAKEIARKLLRSLPHLFSNEADIYDVMSGLRQAGLIAWELEVPDDLIVERPLQRMLERIGDEALREKSLRLMGQLQAVAKAVAAAGGDDKQLNEALARLEEGFTELTGVASTRSAGKMYAGRTLVYEDCRRDLEVTIGPQILDALSAPLALLLCSARWFSYEAALAYRRAFQLVYEQIARKDEGLPVSMARFWSVVEPMLIGDDRQIVEDIATVFQQKWLEILAVDFAQPRLRYASEALAARVAAAFNAPRPGWRQARYHSPDVMIAAKDMEAVERGEFDLVMGELHIAANTLDSLCFVLQHPTPQELFRAVGADLPEPRIIPVIPKNWTRPKRARNVLGLPKDIYLEFGVGAALLPNLKTFASGELIIEPDGDSLIVKSRDGGFGFDIIEFFSASLSAIVVNGFKSFNVGVHTPRISVDRLIIARESWRFAAAEIEFAQEKDDANRFLRARQWARSHALPRFIYVKSPAEVKPFYVDLCSPIYIDIFAKVVRRTTADSPQHTILTVTEMLPTLEQAWLPDSAGGRYTSELRIVAVDAVTAP